MNELATNNQLKERLGNVKGIRVLEGSGMVEGEYYTPEYAYIDGASFIIPPNRERIEASLSFQVIDRKEFYKDDNAKTFFQAVEKMGFDLQFSSDGIIGEVYTIRKVVDRSIN